MKRLETFVERLNKIGIQLELSANVPWIYIDKINGKKVKERFLANHGFTVAFTPVAYGSQMKFTDLKEVFKIIRKYL